MAQLHEILSSNLIDITKAQHRANVFSRQLSKQYKDDKLLRSFPIPNALISNVGINLRYGVLRYGASEDLMQAADLPDGMPNEIHPSPNLFFKKGKLLAAFVLNEVAEELKEKHLPKRRSPQENHVKILKSLRSDKIHSQLGKQVGNSLNRWYKLSRSANEKELDKEEAIAKVRQTVSEVILSEIKPHFYSPRFTEVFEDYQSHFWQKTELIVDQLIAQLLLEIQMNKLLIEESLNSKAMNIFIEAENLSKLPEYALQSINFKVDLQNYKCVVIEPGDEEELVPED